MTDRLFLWWTFVRKWNWIEDTKPTQLPEVSVELTLIRLSTKCSPGKVASPVFQVFFYDRQVFGLTWDLNFCFSASVAWRWVARAAITCASPSPSSIISKDLSMRAHFSVIREFSPSGPRSTAPKEVLMPPKMAWCSCLRASSPLVTVLALETISSWEIIVILPNHSPPDSKLLLCLQSLPCVWWVYICKCENCYQAFFELSILISKNITFSSFYQIFQLLSFQCCINLFVEQNPFHET